MYFSIKKLNHGRGSSTYRINYISPERLNNLESDSSTDVQRSIKILPKSVKGFARPDLVENQIQNIYNEEKIKLGFEESSDYCQMPDLISDCSSSESEDESSSDEDDFESNYNKRMRLYPKTSKQVFKVTKTYKTDINKQKYTFPSRDYTEEELKDIGFYEDKRTAFQVCQDLINKLANQKVKPQLLEFYKKLAKYDISKATIDPQSGMGCLRQDIKSLIKE